MSSNTWRFKPSKKIGNEVSSQKANIGALIERRQPNSMTLDLLQALVLTPGVKGTQLTADTEVSNLWTEGGHKNSIRIR